MPLGAEFERRLAEARREGAFRLWDDDDEEQWEVRKQAFRLTFCELCPGDAPLRIHPAVRGVLISKGGGERVQANA